jgi:hypothetical protein
MSLAFRKPSAISSQWRVLSVVNSGHHTLPADDPYVFLTSALSGNVSVDEYAGFLHIAIIDVLFIHNRDM